MRQISLVGAGDEEVGDYFPEFLDMLEDSPFLKVRENNVKQSKSWVLINIHATSDSNHGFFRIIKFLISVDLAGREEEVRN